MGSPFQALSTASQALQAFQQALDVTGNNIANVNTPGYSRQVVGFGPNTPDTIFTPLGTADIGTGVSVSGVQGMRDMFLFAQMLGANSNLGQTGAQLSGGQSIQTIVGDTGSSGISTDLSSFYNAWSALAAQPNSANLQAVQQAGEQLTTDVQNAYQGLGQLSAQATGQLSSTSSQIDGYAQQIAQLNVQVRSAEAAGGNPSDLIDQRNQALQNLSSLVSVNPQTYNDGTLAVNVGEFDLVDSGGAHAFPTQFDPANGKAVSSTGQTYSVGGGQLGGLFSQINSISSYRSQLDNLANTLTTSVNGVMSTGVTGNGATGQNFFSEPTSGPTGAANFALDPAILADYENIATGASGNTGDTGLAQSIADQANQAVAGLGNVTTGAYYGNLVTSVGQLVATATSTQNTQTSVQTQIQNQIQSVSGVSIDDEMTKMLQFQRSYQAAAETINIANTMLGDLLNIIQ